MLKETGLSEMVKKAMYLFDRKKGNDELAPSGELFHEFN